jgi:hypothetical protein
LGAYCLADCDHDQLNGKNLSVTVLVICPLVIKFIYVEVLKKLTPGLKNQAIGANA